MALTAAGAREQGNQDEENAETITVASSQQANQATPLELKIEALSEITNKPIAVIFYGDRFDPNKDFHVVTLDEPYMARRKCMIISVIVGLIFLLFLAALIYTITRMTLT